MATFQSPNVANPRRAHIFELVAQLVFIALTLVTALIPDIDVKPDTSEATVIVWIVWSWAYLMHVGVKFT